MLSVGVLSWRKAVSNCELLAACEAYLCFHKYIIVLLIFKVNTYEGEVLTFFVFLICRILIDYKEKENGK